VRSFTFSCVVGLATTVATPSLPNALGAEIAWANPAGGNWNLPSNWSPPQVPTPSDHAIIAPSGSPTIVANADVDVAQLTLGGSAGSPILSVPTITRRLKVAGELNILPGATLRHAGVLTNGTLRIGGELAWTGGTLEGSSARSLQIEILPGGRWSLTNEVSRTLRHTVITNTGVFLWTLGRLNAAAGSCRFVNAGSMLLDRNTDGSWTAAAGSTAAIENLASGTLAKTGNADATLEPPVVNHGLLQIDSGSIVLPRGGTNLAQIRIAQGATLDHSGGAFVAEAGTLSGAGTNLIRGSAQIEWRDPASVTLDPGTLRISGGQWNLGAGAQAVIGTTRIDTGSLELASGARLTTDRFDLVGGSLSGSGVCLAQGPTVWNTTTLRDGILLFTSGGLSMTNLGSNSRTIDGASIQNSGPARWTTGSLRTTGARSAWTNALSGTLEIAGGLRWNATAGGTVHIINHGKIQVTPATNPAHLDGNLLNLGSMQLPGSLELLPVSGRFIQDLGETILSGGSLRADLGITIRGGILAGDGTLTGPFENSGTLRPGASPGELRFTHALTLSDRSILDLEIAGASPTQFDRLHVAGPAQLAGTVQVQWVEGFRSVPGQALVWLTCPGGISGRFAAYSPPAGPPWLDLQELTESAQFIAHSEASSLGVRLDASPSIALTAEQRLTLPVTLSFAEGDVASVSVVATADVPDLVPDANLDISGSGRSRTLTVRPNLAGSGTTRVTVTATAPGGARASTSVLLEISRAPIQGLQAYEPFDYATGGALTSTSQAQASNGSVGFTRAWSGSTVFRLAPDSLPYPGLTTAGHQVTCAAQATIQTAVRDLALPLGTPGTRRYLGFLIRPDTAPASGPSFPHFGVLLDTSLAPDFFIGKPGQGATAQWVIEDAGGTHQQASPVRLIQGTPALLVAKFEFENGNDRVSFYVNPQPGTPEPTQPDAVRFDRDLGTIRTLALQFSDAASIDELRIGTSWASVVPDTTQLPPLELQPMSDVVVEEVTPLTEVRALLNGFIAPRVPTFRLTEAPAGMNIHASSGIITWQPDESQGGQTFGVTVEVTDSPAPPQQSATAHFNVTVLEKNNPPQLTWDPTAHLRATRGSPFRLKLGARDNDVPENTFVFQSSGEVPPGLTLSPQGDLEWQPPADFPLGPVSIRIQVTDTNPLAPESSRSLTATYPFQLEVIEPNADLAAGLIVEAGSLSNPDSVAQGRSGTLRLQVTNRGPSSASDVRLTLRSQLLHNNPPQVEFVSSQSSQGQCALETEGVVCRFSNLAPAASVDASVTLRFQLQGQASFELLAASSLPDPIPANNRLPIEIRVTEPAPENPEQWWFSELENLGPTGNQVVMQWDANNDTYLAWFNTSERSLRYAKRVPGNWFIQTMASNLTLPSGPYESPAGVAADALVDDQNLAMAMAEESSLHQPRIAFVHIPTPGIERLSLTSTDGVNGRPVPEPLKIDEVAGSGELGSPVVLGSELTAFLFYRRGDQLLRAEVNVRDSTTGSEDTLFEWTSPPAVVPLPGWRLTRRGTGIAAIDTRTFAITASASDGQVRLIAVRDERSTSGSVTVTPIDLVADNEFTPLHHSIARVGGKLAVAYERVRDGRVELAFADWDGLAWHQQRVPIESPTTRICARPALATGEFPDLVAVCTEWASDGNRTTQYRTWRRATRFQGVWKSEEIYRTEAVSDAAGENTASPSLHHPSRPAIAHISGGGRNEIAFHTGWPSENLVLGELLPRWDITALRLPDSESPVGSPAIGLSDSEEPSVAWTVQTTQAPVKLKRAKRTSGIEGYSGGHVFLVPSDPSGYAQSILGPLSAGSYSPGNASPTNSLAVVSAHPNSGDLQYWTIRQGSLPESPDVSWRPFPVPGGLRKAPGGPTLLASLDSTQVWLTGVDSEGAPAVMPLETEITPPEFPSLAGNTVTPRPSRLLRACFVQGRPGSIDPIIYAVYLTRGSPWTLRLAEFRHDRWTRDVLIADVSENFSGPNAIPLPTDEIPWLAVDWALHPPGDPFDGHGWLYLAYPQSRNAGERTLRVSRLDLSLLNPSLQSVDLVHLPSPLYRLQGLRLRTVRESMRLAYVDGGRLHLGASSSILDLNRVRDMSFETLPTREALHELDLAFEGQSTWLTSHGPNATHVFGLGRFPHTEDTLYGDLYTPRPDTVIQGRVCYLSFAYLIADVFDSKPPSNTPELPGFRPGLQTPTPPPEEPRGSAELNPLRDLRNAMFQTPEGTRLEALYRQFSPEAASLIAAHPKLLIDTIATVRNFLPGVVAYLAGKGHQPIITQGMIDQWNSLWSRVTEAASPAFRSVLVAEKNRLHGFQDFVGKSFDQWAEQLEFPKRSTAPNSLRILSIERSALGFTISVESRGTTSYRLERSERLNLGPWTPVPNSQAMSRPRIVQLSDPSPAPGHGFYRVAELPASPPSAVPIRR